MKKNTFILFLTFFTTTKAFCQPSCKSLSTTQELLNILKDKPVTNINYTSFVNECNVNDLVKNRLLYLIDWRWTKIEIDSYLENYFNSNKE